MSRLLARHWFLAGLALVIGGGLFLGAPLAESFQTPETRQITESAARWLTAVILFLTAITLPGNRLAAAAQAPRSVLWATLVNFVVLPLLAWPLSQCQAHADYRLGIVITASVPSTMASAAVWTRRAGGNDAIALLVTILTNGLCFLITPLWLSFLVGSTVGLDTRRLILDLVICALLPIALGQGLRRLPGPGAFADRHQLRISFCAQICILGVVFGSALRAGPQFATSWQSQGISTLIGLVLSMSGLHLAALALAWWGGKSVGLSQEDRLAAAFSGSQKTLPIGVYLASRMAAQGASGLVIFPVLIYHVAQLFIDSLATEFFRNRTVPESNRESP